MVKFQSTEHKWSIFCPGIPLSSLPPSLARDAVSGFLQVSSRPLFRRLSWKREFCTFLSSSAIFSPYFARDRYFCKANFILGGELFWGDKGNFAGKIYFLRNKSYLAAEIYIFCATNLFARKVNCPLQGIAGGTFLYITFFEVRTFFFRPTFNFQRNLKVFFLLNFTCIPLGFQSITILVILLCCEQILPPELTSPHNRLWKVLFVGLGFASMCCIVLIWVTSLQWSSLHCTRLRRLCKLVIEYVVGKNLQIVVHSSGLWL